MSEIKTEFIRGYEMVPAKMQTKVRDEIMKKCGWSSIMTFHLKRKGKRPIKILEVPVIETVFSQFNINPWTGEYLKN